MPKEIGKVGAKDSGIRQPPFPEQNVTPNSSPARKITLPSHCFCFNNSVKMPPALR